MANPAQWEQTSPDLGALRHVGGSVADAAEQGKDDACAEGQGALRRRSHRRRDAARCEAPPAAVDAPCLSAAGRLVGRCVVVRASPREGR